MSVEVTSVEQQLSIALRRFRRADESSSPDAEVMQAHLEVTAEAVRQHLQDARDVLYRRPALPWIDWWRGTSIEQAYRSVHAAETFLVDVLPTEQVYELIPKVQAGLGAALPATDQQRLAVERLRPNIDPAVLRAGVRRGLDLLYELSDESYARIRTFRNVVLAAAALIATLMIAFVLVVNRFPESIPLCFTSVDSAAGPAPTFTVKTVCPRGEFTTSTPVGAAGADIVIVAGLGLLGGALGAAIAVRKVSGRATPYGVLTALALLKVPTGALTAVSGTLLLGGGFVPGWSALDSQRQIIAYALVFGYAQQLATRLLDERASALLSALPNKESSFAEPTQSAPPALETSPSLVPTITNVTGQLTTEVSRLDSSTWSASISVRTGPISWQRALDGSGAPFRIADGSAAAVANFELAVDAPGFVLAPSSNVSFELPTTGGERSWQIQLTGQRRAGVDLWVSLYSSGRFLRSVELALVEEYRDASSAP